LHDALDDERRCVVTDRVHLRCRRLREMASESESRPSPPRGLSKKPGEASPRPAGKPVPGLPTLEDEIRRRSHYRYMERVGKPGDAETEWRDAEREALGD
jgi:hypothetical protein